MTDPVAAKAARLADRLPISELELLAQACAAGADALAKLRQRSASGTVRTACDDSLRLIAIGNSPDKVAGAIIGAAVAVQRERGRQRVNAVWTGPDSWVASARLTSAVVVDLIKSATIEILLVSFATHSEPSVAAALHAAADAGGSITLLLERTADNPTYSGDSNPFPGLAARRLAWPSGQRESGSASMHAKLLVVDRRVALVGSANVTGHALAYNLECGLLVTGGPTPRRLHNHVDSLAERGCLVEVR